jgi:hypothetical protein
VQVISVVRERQTESVQIEFVSFINIPNNGAEAGDEGDFEVLRRFFAHISIGLHSFDRTHVNKLLMAQCGDRIEANGAARRQIARQGRHGGE